MKILIPSVDLHATNDNPYIRVLAESINVHHNDVKWGDGNKIFWSEDCFSYDIIHIQWPHGLLIDGPFARYSALQMELRVAELKQKGVKIVTTCHNLVPHYEDNPDYNRAYEIAYEMSDCILHLGSYSMKLFRNKYPHARHELLLHHVYDTVYPSAPSFEESIRHLGLSSDCSYILCFGNFRADEERQLVINLSKRLTDRPVKILAPSFYRVAKRRNLIIFGCKYAVYLYYKLRYRKILTTPFFVDEKELKYYYGAASISLIQRVRILNSGNVPLGFYMKKCVVGPDCGNVGPWLRETGNPTFIPGDDDSVYRAINEALDKPQQGEANYLYVMNELTTDHQAERLYQIYKGLIEG